MLVCDGAVPRYDQWLTLFIVVGFGAPFGIAGMVFLLQRAVLHLRSCLQYGRRKRIARLFDGLGAAGLSWI